MKIELLHPSGDSALTKGFRLALAVRVLDETNAAVPHASVTWAIDGHEHGFEQATTTADQTGVARNTAVLSAAPAIDRGTVTVRTTDDRSHQLGAYLVVSHATEIGGVLFHPASTDLPVNSTAVPAPAVAAAAAAGTKAAAAKTAGTKATGNTLTIYYPGSGVKLAWGVPQYAWAQYLNGAGQPLAGQSLVPSGDGAVYINPNDPKPVTDQNGWATIKIQVTPSLGDNPPFAPQDATGNLYLKAQGNPGDQTQASITFSTTMGGRGYLTATPGTGRTQGYWWPVKVAYQNPDGTPIAHRKLIWNNLSGMSNTVYPVSFSWAPQNPPPAYATQESYSYTDQNGQSTLYILTNSGYGQDIQIPLAISSNNVLNATPDTVLTGPLQVARRPYSASIWPNLSGDISIRAPGQQVALTLRSKNPIPDGKTITWKSLDPRVTISYPSTQVQNGTSINWVTGQNVDSLYNATVYAESTYPPGYPEQAYFTLTFGYGQSSGFGNLSPSSMSPLSSGDWHTFTLTYSGGAAGQPVQWLANPADKIEFKPPYPGTLSANGKCSVDLRAVGVSEDTRISIQAQVYNANSGQYDIAGSVYTFLGQVHTGSTIVVNPITPAPVLYAPSSVTATYTKDNKPVQGASIQWAATPSNTVAFSPNISQTNAQGIASTTMTAYGPNQAIDLTVVASAYDDTTQETVAGNLEVQVAKAQTPPASSAAWLDLVSLEGDTLWGLRWHLLQVSYLHDDGTPVAGKRQINWSLPGGNGAVLKEASTWTDDNGVATNLIQGPGTFQGDLIQSTVRVSAVNPQTSQTDTSDLSLVLTANNIEPASRLMTITVNGTQPIQSGYACPISVKYTQENLTDPMVDAPITWAVYPYVEDSAQPPYELSFGQPNPTYTGVDGVAHNTITYNGTQDLGNAILVASCFNAVTGQTDFTTYALSFTYVSALTGIMITRPWSTNPDSGNVIPSIPCQILGAKMTLASGQGDGQIKLTTQPSDLGTQIFDGTTLAPIQPTGGVYTISTQNGSAEIVVGARFPSFFNLQAYYPASVSQPVCSTDLWLSTLGGKYGDIRFPMTIQNLDTTVSPPVLAIPDKSTWPNPAFTVSIPANGNGLALKPDDPVLILLNYRVAYTGKVEDVQSPNSISIAYAMLQPTGNSIAYLAGPGKAIQQKGNLVFNAQGTAQTFPTTGSIAATLSMPSLVPGGLDSVLATDVVNGIKVRILPTSTQKGWSYQAGDVITVYFYLSGKYPLPDAATRYCASITQPARNVASIQYTVQAGDPLTSSQAQIIGPLPQHFLAGYGAPGTLAMNFKVQRGTTTYWSKPSATISMNTASLDSTL